MGILIFVTLSFQSHGTSKLFCFHCVTGMLYLLSNPRDVPVDDLVTEEDIVVVTLSYRVNAFGFFCYEDPLMPGKEVCRNYHKK